jgi:DNA-binding LytR/AlgR family response regulator
MNKLRCLAVDDESHALKILQLYIEKTPFLELTVATTSPWEALEIIRQGEIDLIFLDIQMEELTGMQLLDVVQTSCPVIITTAYTDYAVEGYEYDVTDYLLKPYSFERFLKAVRKVQESEAKKGINLTNTEKQPQDIFVKGDSKNSFHRIRLSDICYIEGLKNYVRFIVASPKGLKSIITLQNLKDLENQLPAGLFMRIHRSYIVNLAHIERVEGNSVAVLDKLLPLGQSYRQVFFGWIEQYS